MSTSYFLDQGQSWRNLAFNLQPGWEHHLGQRANCTEKQQKHWNVMKWGLKWKHKAEPDPNWQWSYSGKRPSPNFPLQNFCNMHSPTPHLLITSFNPQKVFGRWWSLGKGNTNLFDISLKSLTHKLCRHAKCLNHGTIWNVPCGRVNNGTPNISTS